MLGSMAAIIAGRTPAEDPAFLAYLRTIGVDEGELGAEVNYRTAQLAGRYRRKLPEFRDAANEGAEKIGLDFEDRGFSGSGARLVAQARQRRDVARDALEYEAGIREQMSDLQFDAARSIAKGRRGLADEELAARGRMAEADAYAGFG